MIPVFYCLMTRKTTKAYKAVFKFIEKKLLKLKPSVVMTDYEEGLRKAVREHWRLADIRGCWFHFKRAINRKCKNLGLWRFLKNNADARKVKGMLCDIPLIPPTQIYEAYASIEKYAKKMKVFQRMANLFSYFKSYWLKQVR